MEVHGTLAVIGVGEREDPRVLKMNTHPESYQIYAYCPHCKETKVVTVPLGLTVEQAICATCNNHLMHAF